MSKISILGVNVDTLTISQAIERITDQASGTKPCRYVIKPYVEFIERASRERDVADILNAAWLSLADGISIKWAAYYLYGGKRSFRRWIESIAAIVLAPKRLDSIIPERFGGINFTWALLKACQHQGLSIYLVGSPRHRHISQTAAFLSAELPGLNIVGSFPGSLTPSARLHLGTELQKHKPDIVLVGVGFPLQEELMHELSSKLKHGVLIGEGGSFDYTAFGGRLHKAPEWMQKSGLEWLWRLLLDPWRLSRQLAIPRFMWRVYRKRHQHPLKLGE